jgi:hypothetical protein
MTFDELCAWMKSQILPCTVLLAIGQGNPPRVINQGSGMLLATGTDSSILFHCYSRPNRTHLASSKFCLRVSLCRVLWPCEACKRDNG